jgi:hypothetical protein
VIVAIRSALTSFDDESGVETVVDSIEHIGMIVRSIVFDEISHGVGDFFVFRQSDHWFTSDDLCEEKKKGNVVICRSRAYM